MNNANTNNHSLAALHTCRRVLKDVISKKEIFKDLSIRLVLPFMSQLSSPGLCSAQELFWLLARKRRGRRHRKISLWKRRRLTKSRNNPQQISRGLTLDWPRHGGHPHLTVFFIFSGMQCVVCQVPWIKFKLWAVDNLPSILFRDQYYMVNFVLGAIRCVTLHLTATTVWFIWGLFLWSSLIIPNNESCSPQAVFCCFSLFSILFLTHYIVDNCVNYHIKK